MSDLVTFCVWCLVIGAVIRGVMAVGYPEQYERLRKYEKQRSEDRREMAAKILTPLAPAGKQIGASLLKRFFK